MRVRWELGALGEPSLDLDDWQCRSLGGLLVAAFQAEHVALLDGHGPLGTRVLLDRVAVVSNRIEGVGPALVLAKRRARERAVVSDDRVPAGHLVLSARGPGLRGHLWPLTRAGGPAAPRPDCAMEPVRRCAK